jgi:hypothetical protein
MNAKIAMSKLEPAYGVIRKFDTQDQRGTEVLATRLGIVRSAVTRWALAREKGGTGGYIPPRYYDDILAFAKQQGIALDPAEFVVAAEPADETHAEEALEQDDGEPEEQGTLALQAAE